MSKLEPASKVTPPHILEKKPSNIDYHLSPALREAEDKMFKFQMKKTADEEKEPANLKVKDAGGSKVPSMAPSPVMKARSEEFNLGDVTSKRIAKVRATLESIKDTMDKLRSTNQQVDLKNYDAKAFPYLTQVIAHEIPEVHSLALQIINSTYNHFTVCNDAFVVLISNILGLYEAHHHVGSIFHPRT